MKKYLKLMLVFLFVGVGMLFAQENGEIPEIPDVQYLIANFGTLMLTFTGIAAVATFLAELFIRVVKTTKKAVKVAFVLVVGVGLTFLSGVVFKEGDYAVMLWWQKIFWGLLSGAAAAGLRGTNLLWVKAAVEFLIGLILKKEPTK
jgi:hypothetical protein